MGPYPVAQLDNYKGLLFATFDPEATLDNVPTALLRIRPLAAGLTANSSRSISNTTAQWPGPPRRKCALPRDMQVK